MGLMQFVVNGKAKNVGNTEPLPVSASATSVVLGQLTPTSAALVGVAQVIAVPMDGFSSGSFYFSGVHAGFNLIFEQSPDSTDGVDGVWFATLGSSVGTSSAPSTTTGSLTANSSVAFDVSCPGAAWLRARVTARTSGTLTARTVPSTASLEFAPSIATHAVTLTSTTVAAPASNIAGALIAKVTAGASTNATLVKASAARLLGIQLVNLSASPRFVRLYSKATAPVPGTDVPAMVIGLPPGGRSEREHLVPVTFALGLGYAITGAAADLDATAVGALDVLGTLSYV